MLRAQFNFGRIWTLAVSAVLCLMSGMVFPEALSAQIRPDQLLSDEGASNRDGDSTSGPDASGGADSNASDGEEPDPDDSPDDGELDFAVRPDIPLTRLPSFDTPVQIVTRTESTVGRSPAAVYVLERETILRSGKRTLPDVLSMVPGLYVAQINGSIWNVSSRGFSSRFARKLLIQVDGRTVYTPLTAGTFWDINDVLLEDIERIEVIRGPGATVWGANAVNGVINIITRSAAKTHGSYYQAGGGTEQRGFAAARVGGQTESGVNYRVWGKWFERGSLYSPTQLNFDDWRQGRVGFRADWESDLSDSYTVQGDLYTGSNGIANDQPVVGLEVGNEPVAGGYVLSRWTRELEENGKLQLQMYYNKWNRDTLGFKQNHDTFDIDMQHQFNLDDRNEVVWGLAFRQIWDRLPNDRPLPLISYNPDQRTYTFFSAFIQDSYELSEDELYVMAGAKLLDNTFTRFEVQPGARLLYLPNRRTAMWAAVSRAIRTPSRTSQDGNVVVGDIGGAFPVRVLGSHDLDSEETLVYEMGIRQQPSDDFSWDLSLFYNVDQRLISFRPTTTPGTLQFFNGAKSDSYGFELTGQFELTDDWRLTSWYAFLRTVGTSDPRAVVPSADLEEGTPRHQAFMMSSWDVGERCQLDLLARYVDNNASLNVPSFISMDLRAAWQATDALELTLVGQNLLDSHRPEYGSSLFVHEVATEVRRGVYGMATVRY